MSEKATVGSVPVTKSQPISAPAHCSRQSAGFSSSSPFLSLQQALGNQAMLQLFESGAIQAKLRISQPGDADEVEADRVADRVVAATHAPQIHRKCACSGGGSSCPECESEEVEQAKGIHRSVAHPLLHSASFAIQRAPAASAPTNTPDQVGNPPQPSPTPAHSHPLVVEDDAKSVAPHQMRKSAFIALLRTDACATADAVLASVGHTTKSCPYIEKWLGFYEKQSSDHIERAILKYAPETATARNAHEAIRLVVMRVQRAAMTWAKTGKVSGLPEDLASQIPGQGGFLGAIRSFASTGVGGAILGFIGGSKSEKSAGDTGSGDSSGAMVSRKASDGSAAPAHDAAAVRSQLGTGHSLDSRVQSQMSAAFGRDFSGVRVHTDSRASGLSSDLRARAFTIGSDVAFASGEYKPGTPIGDALIAHELAHVVQQSEAAHSSRMSKPADPSAGTTEPATSHLENEADLSAVGAVASIWTGAKRGLADLRQNAIPRLRSGLRLQRCAHHQADATALRVPPMPGPAAKGTCRGSPIHIEVQKDKDLSGTFTTHALDAVGFGSQAVISVPGSATKVAQHEEGNATLKWSNPGGKGGTDTGTFVNDWEGTGDDLQADKGNKFAVDAHVYGLSGRPGVEARRAAEKNGFNFETSNWELVEDLVFTTTAHDGAQILHRCTWGYRFHAVQTAARTGPGGGRSRTATVNYWGVDSEKMRGS